VSIPERILRISKAYLNQVRDRIDTELTDAERELDAGRPGSVDSTTRRESAAAMSESDAEAMMRRAEERIAAARRDLEGRTELRRPSADAPTAGTTAATAANGAAAANGNAAGTSSAANLAARNADPNATDFRVLGVEVGSDLPTVTSAYEKLARRCDPRRFPDGSTEQKEAERILTRVNASYEALRKRLDPTQNRFGKLEFE
jgi:hypothetical protein